MTKVTALCAVNVDSELDFDQNTLLRQESLRSMSTLFTRQVQRAGPPDRAAITNLFVMHQLTCAYRLFRLILRPWVLWGRSDPSVVFVKRPFRWDRWEPWATGLLTPGRPKKIRAPE